MVACNHNVCPCLHSNSHHSSSLHSQHVQNHCVYLSLTWSAGGAVCDVHQLGDVGESAWGTLLRFYGHLRAVVTHWTPVSINTLLGGSRLGP